jgi:hypothetical protein
VAGQRRCEFIRVHWIACNIAQQCRGARKRSSSEGCDVMSARQTLRYDGAPGFPGRAQNE